LRIDSGVRKIEVGRIASCAFLGIFRFAAVLDRCARQIIGVELFLDVIAQLVQCFVGKRQRIGTHVGDQAYGAAADIHTFVKLLGSTHRALGGKAQLTHRFLLQRRSGEWWRRLTALGLALDAHHFGRALCGLFDVGDHLPLVLVGDDCELLDLVAAIQKQARAEFLFFLVAVEMYGPVFAALEFLDFQLTFDDESQRWALYPAGGQPRPIFFHNSGDSLKPTK